MHRPTDILFVLTDGGRARFVKRSPENGHFRTLAEMDGEAALRGLRRDLRAQPPGRAFASSGRQRSAVGSEESLRRAKAAFVAKVAEQAAKVCRQQGLEAVVLAAPAQWIGALKAGLEGHAKIAGAVRKDLTKTPNADLGAWLNDIFSKPDVAR